MQKFARKTIWSRSARRWLKRILIMPTILLILLGIGIGGVEASDGMQGNNCVIDRNQEINHDFYFVCWRLTVRGKVNGDLIGIASEVTIAPGSEVDGDIWVGGARMVVEGNVSDDIRFLGGKVEITDRAVLSTPDIDIAAAAISVEVDEGAYVPGDVLVIGYQALIDGDVGRNIDFQGQRLQINGEIRGNVDAVVGNNQNESPLRATSLPYDIQMLAPGFLVGDGGSINGNLTYEAPQEVNLRRNAVQGEYSYTQSLNQTDITLVEQSETFFSILRTYAINVLQSFVSLMIVGLFMLQFMPIMMIEPGRRVQRTFMPAFSWGLMIFILSFPISLIMLVLSVIVVLVITLVTLSSLTLPAALFLIVVNIVLLGGFWFTLIFVARAISCFVIGVFIWRRVLRWWEGRNTDPDDPPVFVPVPSGKYRWVALAIGVIIFSLIIHAPIPSSLNNLKLLIQAPVAFIGLGAIFMYGRDLWHITRGQLMESDLSVDRWDSSVPIDKDVPLGLDNLPNGFDGRFE